MSQLVLQTNDPLELLERVFASLWAIAQLCPEASDHLRRSPPMFKILALVVLFLPFLHPALARAEHPLATQYATCTAYYHTLAGVYDSVDHYKAIVLRRRVVVARKALTTLVGADTTAVARIEAALERLAFAFNGSLWDVPRLEAAYEATCTDVLLPLTR